MKCGMTATQRRYVRGLAHHAKLAALRSTGRLNVAYRAAAASGSIAVLTFHRIVPDSALQLCRSPRGMVLRQSVFAALIDYLSMNAIVLAPEEAGNPSRRADKPKVLLTFDDGWLDNLEVAQPYLAAAGMRACFFMPTSVAGRSRAFWPERLLGLFQEARQWNALGSVNRLLAELSISPRLRPEIGSGGDDEDALAWFKTVPPERIFEWIDSTLNRLWLEGCIASDIRVNDPMEQVMTWDQLRSLALAGHKIGSHSCTHAILPQLDPKAMVRELCESFGILKQEIPMRSRDPMWISYPSGAASREVSLAAMDAGYRFGFVNSPGFWSSRSNPHLLPRINVWDGTLTEGNGPFSEKHLLHALYWRPAHRDSEI